MRPLRRRWRRAGAGFFYRAAAATSPSAFELAAVHGTGSRGGTFPRRSLIQFARNAVLGTIIRDRSSGASRSLSGEVVEGIGEVAQGWQLTNAGRYYTGESVTGDVELLQALHFGYGGGGQRPLKMVEAHIKDGKIPEAADLGRQATGEIVIQQNNLVESLPHVADATRNATPKIIVGQHKHRNGRVAEIVGDAHPEPVVVEENGIEILVEELGRNGAFELVKTEIQVLEGRQGEHHFGEVAHKAVVAEIQLVEQFQSPKAGGDYAAEAVGVDVEESEVGEEA